MATDDSLPMPFVSRTALPVLAKLKVWSKETLLQVAVPGTLQATASASWRVMMKSTNGVTIMDYDDKLIEEAVLALLVTFSFDNGNS
jgi:branched-subunit amino acid transport protein AzlD